MTEKHTSCREKSLDDLDHVLMLTTDQGPFVCDMFLILVFHDGAEWRVPGENPCYREFFDALGKALPLDDEQVLLAAVSIADSTFSLWEREKHIFGRNDGEFHRKKV